MKTTILLSLLLAASALGQPVLKTALTTNSANVNAFTNGCVAVYSNGVWIAVSTNQFGGGGAFDGGVSTNFARGYFTNAVLFKSGVTVEGTATVTNLNSVGPARIGGGFTNIGVSRYVGNAHFSNDVTVTGTMGVTGTLTGGNGSFSTLVGGTFSADTVTFNWGNGAVSVLIDSDNFVVPVSTSYLTLESDDGTAGNRTFTLDNGNFAGQILILKWADTDAGELLDTGSSTLSAAWVPGNTDTLFLIWDSVAWVEVSRSNN